MENVSEFIKIEIKNRAKEISSYWGDPRFSTLVDQEIATLKENEFEFFMISMGEMMEFIKIRQDRLAEIF